MSFDEDNVTRDTILTCLTKQLSEFELLKSMYPRDDEIVLTDQKVVTEMNKFINSVSEYSPNHLDFVINLSINDMKLEVCVNLPTFYPEEEPDIYVRCNQINRQQETSLNTELTNYIKNNYAHEVCLYNVVSWLQENVYSFIKITEDKPVDELPDILKGNFVRLWVYSHHIYNKKKREEIVKTAKELDLTGFCSPGKPGIICIEGRDSHCKQWWKHIKSLCWKKIVIRKTELFDSTEQSKHQKFQKFEELCFQKSTIPHSKHGDMSEFSKFMGNLGLTNAFNEFFGLCNE